MALCFPIASAASLNALPAPCCHNTTLHADDHKKVVLVKKEEEKKKGECSAVPRLGQPLRAISSAVTWGPSQPPMVLPAVVCTFAPEPQLIAAQQPFTPPC